jgi:hypothetical protein
MRHWILGLTLALAGPAACGGSHGPDDGGQDAADGSDGGDEPATVYHARFALGAQACAGFMVQRTARQELALRVRARFAPQTLELRPGAQSEVEWLDSLEFGGPAPEQALPLSAAALSHRRETLLNGFCDRFELAQTFELASGAHRLGLTARLSFCTREGVADPSELVFDSDQAGEPPRDLTDTRRQVELALTVDSGASYLTERQQLGSCTLTQAGAYLIQLEMEGGDTLEARRRYQPPLMGTGVAGLTWARVRLAGESREVEDPFHLAYGADLHNMAERFLVVLEPPLGAVHGLHWQETDQGGLTGPPLAVQFLDAALDPDRPLGEAAVTGYVETPE